MSGDDVASHKDFCAADGLPFTLLADTGGEVARAFGVPLRDGGPKRTTFVIDRLGVVRKVFPQVKVWGHSTEVLAALGALAPGLAPPKAPNAPRSPTP